MKISSKARSAVQAMVQLALLDKGKEYISLSHLTKEDGLSVTFLEQIFAKLKKTGFVISHRGLNGGYKMSKRLNEITIFSIIEAVAPIERAVKCAGQKGGCTPSKVKCATHDLWKSIDILTRHHLQSVTLEDVVEKTILLKSVVS